MSSPTTGFQSVCQICKHGPLDTVVSLGHQPVVQEYLTKKTLHEPEQTYPLNLCRCSTCGLLQLDYIVAPSTVFFKDYPYRTGLTNMLIRNFRSLADTLTETYQLTNDDLIIDIGSNDGTLLAGFKEKGMRVLGVEPTNAAKDANKNGITTLQKFFDRPTAVAIKKRYGGARIVTATNVFAHINNVPELMRNIKTVLANNGVFVSESQYLMDIFEKLEFDTIYHEHLRFYSLKPLVRLFSLYGCSLIDAERISAAGGSIRVFVKKGKHPMSARAKQLIAAEVAAGLYKQETWTSFAERIISAKHKLIALLIDCKRKGGGLVGIGSPARANTLLGFTHTDSQLLDYTGEKFGSPKIDMYTPGTHIPVVDEQQLIKQQPAYAVLLSWHIGEELMKIFRKNGYRGKFIMPLPNPHIVDTV